KPSGRFTVQGRQVLVRAAGFTPGAHITATYHSTAVGTAVADAQGAVALSFPLPPGAQPGYRLVLTDAVGNRVTVTQLAGSTLQASVAAGRVSVIGAAFTPNQTVRLTYHGIQVATATTDGTGGFRTSFQLPASVR